MDVSLRWKCIYLITCVRQGFPGLKFTLKSVTQLHAELRAVPGNSLSLKQANRGKGAWATGPPAVLRRPRAHGCREEHHGATESLEWVPGVVTKPQKVHLPESQPRLQGRAAALARSLWGGAVSGPPVLGMKAPHMAVEEDSVLPEQLLRWSGWIVWGRGSGRKLFQQYLPHQTWQWVSPQWWCGTPGEGRELQRSTHFQWNCTNVTVLPCKFHFGLCFKRLLLLLACFGNTYFGKSLCRSSLFLQS